MRVGARPHHRVRAGDVRRRRARGGEGARQPLRGFAVRPPQPDARVRSQHAAVREDGGANRAHHGLVREEPRRQWTAGRERRQAGHPGRCRRVRVYRVLGRAGERRDAFFRFRCFGFGFRHRRRVASATLVVASGARARRRGHGEAFPAPLHRLSGSVRAQQRALPRLLPARVLQRGAEQLPPAPPAQVAATRVVRVPESSGGGERLVVAAHHDELTSGVASLEPQAL